MASKREQAALDIIAIMDGAADGVVSSAEWAQSEIYRIIIEALDKFELSDGRFVTNQDYSSRILLVEEKINEIIKSNRYSGAIADYLSTYSTIQERNVAFQRDFNQIKVDHEKLSPARKTSYKQAANWLKGAGLNEAYIQPAKYLLMQQVTNGVSISEARKLLDKWNDGELKTGVLTSNRQTPNLKKYANQLSRDNIHQMNGSINEIIKTEYELDGLIYVGDVIKDSRPLCKHLVNLDRDIALSEIPALLKLYPDGTIPGTNKKNFIVYRGGFSCRHAAVPVRLKK